MSRLRLFLKILGFALLALAVTAAALGVEFGEDLRHISLAQPLWLLTALAPLAAVAFRVWRAPRPATLRFSRARTAARMKAGFAARIVDLPDGLRLADHVEHEGIDIAIALDLSDSMESQDLFPNRLEAAKQVIDEFIAQRPHDRVSMVAFGATASTVAPLTLDHDVVRMLVRKLQLGGLDGTRTAIGAGIGVSLNRLAESEAKSKVLVLLTDGVHNAEGIDPDSAAQEAADRGVAIYTVLIGRHQGQNIDPGRLERIASATGGYAYTAEDREALTTSFQDLLNKLERSTIAGEPVRAELFSWLLWPALLLLFADVLLRTTRLRRFP